ncbi:hypothetical protein C7974DRAFT_315527 [Boeremia exigua]|uniref:uncharacterized protein n=1 Tax=Boeremia exigua TaxID=749465 RepID=UPI001E8CA592|nr:uncharacterized protein C7974DRAFT_315527 [Boeremia exigua]KAH6622056.1 hypothetical protein C7974DRAFT_315527 [Boeremia exigua]
MSTLCDLPNEILLEVVRGLGAIWSFETQSEAFKCKRTEIRRQRENHLRQRTLHALCLTSRRLRCLSIPTLYASSATSATRAGLTNLQLLHRTLSDPNSALDQTRRLAEYVRSVENRLADFQGNSLQDDEAFQQGPSTTYFQLLADLVSCAPNIEHLCIVSLEYEEVSFWSHVLTKSLCFPYRSSTQLVRLSAQIHAPAWSSSREVSVLERMLRHAQSLPKLEELRISGATTGSSVSLAFKTDEIGNLRRLDLLDCSLEIDEVGELVFGCKHLRHLICKWAFVRVRRLTLRVLHMALLARAETLETLTLDWQEIRCNTTTLPGRTTLESIRSMKSLRALDICELGFLNDDHSLLDLPGQIAENALSELLPESLEQMTLILKGKNGDYDDHILENASCLWQLSDDCRTSMSQLKTICIKAGNNMCTPSLADAFASVGVELHTEIVI